MVIRNPNFSKLAALPQSKKVSSQKFSYPRSSEKKVQKPFIQTQKTTLLNSYVIAKQQTQRHVFSGYSIDSIPDKDLNLVELASRYQAVINDLNTDNILKKLSSGRIHQSRLFFICACQAGKIELTHLLAENISEYCSKPAELFLDIVKSGNVEVLGSFIEKVNKKRFYNLSFYRELNNIKFEDLISSAIVEKQNEILQYVMDNAKLILTMSNAIKMPKLGACLHSAIANNNHQAISLLLRTNFLSHAECNDALNSAKAKGLPHNIIELFDAKIASFNLVGEVENDNLASVQAAIDADFVSLPDCEKALEVARKQLEFASNDVRFMLLAQKSEANTGNDNVQAYIATIIEKKSKALESRAKMVHVIGSRIEALKAQRQNLEGQRNINGPQYRHWL